MHPLATAIANRHESNNAFVQTWEGIWVYVLSALVHEWKGIASYVGTATLGARYFSSLNERLSLRGYNWKVSDDMNLI